MPMYSSAEALLAARASRRDGVFLRADALRAGLSSAKISRLISSGRWRVICPGVYADAAAPASEQQETMAAWLACGPASAVSHRSALRLLGVDAPRPPRPEVTVPDRSKRRPRGVTTYHSAYLSGAEVAGTHGIRITSPARTLLDASSVLDPGVIEVVLDAMWRRSLVTPEGLARYLAAGRWRTRPGSRHLRVLATARMGSSPPGSDMESVYRQILRRYNVPLGEFQFPVTTAQGIRRIDCAYPGQLVAIELDGFEAHQGTRKRFDDDRARETDLRRLGWDFRRFTWTQLTKDPLWVATITADALGLMPAGWKPTGRGGRPQSSRPGSRRQAR